MLRDANLRDPFFEAPMQELLGLQTPIEALQLPRNRKATMVKCADSITAYIKRFADETETTAALAHLEGVYFPHDLLPNWISRLRNLTSLRIRDGSVLGVEAAKAISECCPNFVDLTCYYCSNADEDLAAFFQTLRPNSLQSFEVISQNGIGEQALTALNAHATSLRSLILGSLPPQGMTALNSLASCTALEVLSIENDVHNLRVMSDMEGVLKEVSAWISSCKSLRHLSFNHFLSILPVVKDVLLAPGIRLQSLSIVDFLYHDPGEATWAALSTQDRLESLTIGLHNRSIDGLPVHEGSLLTDSILKLKSLTTLNFMQAYIDLSTLQRLPEALPNLVEFSFSGDPVDDSILAPLSHLSQLKLLSINAPSSFTYPGLFDFVRKLAATPGREGMRIDILNQHGHMVDSEEHNKLQDFMADRAKGRIDITYTNYPDELHEEDFSDFSD
ncbi:hypothetical protein Hte_010981 [Hypoxylon texense]